MGKAVPFPLENRIPDLYYQDPRSHPENKVWMEALSILEPVLAKAREEAMEAAKVATHTELHQDDPSRPLYQLAKVLSVHVTHEVALQMDKVWKGPNKEDELEKLFKLIDERLQTPNRVTWWKSVIKESSVAIPDRGVLESEGKP